jgi:hypothetical protein
MTRRLIAVGIRPSHPAGDTIVSSKGPVDVLVIDHVERPTEN